MSPRTIPTSPFLLAFPLSLAAFTTVAGCAVAPPVAPGLVQPLAADTVPSTSSGPAVMVVEEETAVWKERMAQAYVFLERRGDYRLLGAAMREIFELAERHSLETVGPPFGLFYDDPGRVDTGELRARVCLPVAGRPSDPGPLRFDVLPRAMVVYARVPGPYPEAPRVIPALLESMERLGWAQGGPIREVYLVNPALAGDYEELVTEVQIPWGIAH